MPKKLYVVDPVSNLYSIDPVTASTRLIGPIGFPSVTDIAFHGPTLYAISFSQFFLLDPATGAGTVIGSIGFSANGLAIASNGKIYAGTTDGNLIWINPVTGAGTLIGNFGGGLISSGDLAFDSNDFLYGVLNSGNDVVLAKIDPSSGAATVIGSTGLNALYGIDFFCCRLYGTTPTGELVDINVSTGNATVIGKNNIVQWGLTTCPSFI